MPNKINIGIIGKNFGYNVIYKSFIKNKKYNIKAFCFKSKNSDKIKIPKDIKVYSSWKKLILNKRINAIAIATPPSLHKDIIKFAIKNKKHVFCEKPFTASKNEADYICKLMRRDNQLCHLVNYEFAEINAFSYLKKNYIKNIKINKIFLNWFIRINKRPKYSWKEDFSKGGGLMFNYFCHAIYYLELLFGKIISVKTDVSIEKNKKIKTLKGNIFFRKAHTVKINVKVGSIQKSIINTHELKIISNNKIYLLKTKLNSLSDNFELIELNKNNKKKFNKILFKNKKINTDFRINPTFKNAKKFFLWITKKKIQSPNFFDAQRIHMIINKIISSSKNKKKINII